MGRQKPSKNCRTYLDESTRSWERSLPGIPRFPNTEGLGTSPTQQLFGCVGWRPSFLQLTVFCTMLMLLLLRAQLLQARKDRQPFCYIYNSGSKALLPYHWRKETQFVSDLQAQSVVDPSDCTGTSGCALISSTCIYKWQNGVSEESSSSPSDNWDPKVTTSWCRDT